MAYMEKGVNTTESLGRIMDAAGTRNPHNKEIIEAFRPILLECRRLAQALPESSPESVDFDEQSFKAGIPLLRQNDLAKDAPWDKLALDLISKIVQGMPTLKVDLERFADYLRDNPRALSKIMQANADTQAALIDQCASEAGVGREALGFLAHYALRIILERHSHAWADLLEGFAWDKGYCPICGGAPMMARIEEGIPRRWLYCSRCSHAWQFSRVICPACANDDQQSMTYFSVEDAEQQSTFACEHCKHYLITVNKLTELADFDPDVACLSLIHLDVLMQEKGYHPMAATAWNELS
jgi:FdhE protein